MREVRWWIWPSTAPAGERRDERENTARESTNETNKRDETLTKPGTEEGWQGMVAPNPNIYLKDNGQRK